MGIKAMQNYTLRLKLLRKIKKICKQKSYRQKKCAKLQFVLVYTNNIQSFEIDF